VNAAVGNGAGAGAGVGSGAGLGSGVGVGVGFGFGCGFRDGMTETAATWNRRTVLPVRTPRRWTVSWTALRPARENGTRSTLPEPRRTLFPPVTSYHLYVHPPHFDATSSTGLPTVGLAGA
jgi:hypothetical protein